MISVFLSDTLNVGSLRNLPDESAAKRCLRFSPHMPARTNPMSATAEPDVSAPGQQSLFRTACADGKNRSAQCATAFLLVGMSLCWWLAGERLLTRPFWMDEIHSWLLITDPDPGHALAALADGADYNPPAYFLAARWIAAMGPITEQNLRLLSLGCTFLAMLALYLMLARNFSVAASLAATVFAASHPLMVLQSTEARFYAFWLCLLMWYCWLLTKSTTGGCAKACKAVGLVILVITICATHYFGIISVVLVTAAWTGCHGRDGKRVTCGALLTVAAIATVACCMPFFLGQKAALSCDTWVKPPTLSSSFRYLKSFVPLLPLSLCCGVAFFARIRRQQNDSDSATASTPPHHVRTWPVEANVLLALAGMPLALILFSWLIQPALVDRYATTAVVAVAPVLAWLLSAAAPVLQRSVSALTWILLILAIRHAADTWDHSLQKQDRIHAALAQLSPNDVVIFEDRVDYWMLKHQHPESLLWYQVDFTRDDVLRPSNLRTVQRDVARKIAVWYPEAFAMKPVNDWKRFHRIIVVPYVEQDAGALRYPEIFQRQSIGGHLLQLSQAEDSASSQL